MLKAIGSKIRKGSQILSSQTADNNDPGDAAVGGKIQWILRTKRRAENFLRYLESTLQSENFEFYLEVTIMKGFPPSRIPGTAIRITNTYVLEGSQSQVNLPFEIVENIEDRISQQDFDNLFDEAEEHIKFILEAEAIPRFIKFQQARSTQSKSTLSPSSSSSSSARSSNLISSWFNPQYRPPSVDFSHSLLIPSSSPSIPTSSSSTSHQPFPFSSSSYSVSI